MIFQTLSDLIRTAAIVVLAITLGVQSFVIHSDENLILTLNNAMYNQTKIDALFSERMHIILHNQYTLQQEINSMTNSSQVIDGFNMTSGQCAKGYTMHLGKNGMTHCDWQGLQ